MSKFNTLFLVKNGILEINKPEAREIPEYKALIVRDKGTEGDSEGRKKQGAMRELLYIYLILDPRSMYYNLSKEERKELAKAHCKFPDNWKPDELMQDAAKRYKKDMVLTGTGKAYVAAEQALFSVSSDAEFFQEQIDQYKHMLAKRNKLVLGGNLGETEKTATMAEISALMQDMINLQDKLLKNIDKIPKLQETVTTLLNKYMEEEGGKKAVYGGGSLGNRETVS
jgi:hypothetical protein